MALELTPFQKFQKTFGLSLQRLQVCFRWVNVSMAILPMLDLTRGLLLASLIILCTTPLMMSSETVHTWEILRHDTIKRLLISKILMPLVCSLTTTTTHVSCIITQVLKLISRTLPSFLLLAEAFHSSTMEPNNTTTAEMIHKTENQCGNHLTHPLISIRLLKK